MRVQSAAELDDKHLALGMMSIGIHIHAFSTPLHSNTLSDDDYMLRYDRLFSDNL